MGGHLHEGLTTHDFHPQPCVNPRDVLRSRSQQSSRSFGTRPSSARSTRRQQQPRSPLANNNSCDTGCCPEDETDQLKARSRVLDCCSDTYDTALFDYDSLLDLGLPDCCAETIHSSPAKSPRDVADCEECQEECDECIEEHKDCDEVIDLGLEDCPPCLDEHIKQCDKSSSTCNVDCNDCDFSCFDCIDWSQFPEDKSLGLSYPIPFLNTSISTDNMPITFENLALDDAGFSNDFSSPSDIPVAPLDLPMHHQCFDFSTISSNDMFQSQVCNINPTTFSIEPAFEIIPPISNLVNPGYGCHPATAHYPASKSSQNQTSLWSGLSPGQPMTNFIALPALEGMAAQQKLPELPASQIHVKQESQMPIRPVNVNQRRVCEWLMPCGNKCDATFGTTTDLKKHVKALHICKGTTTCRWADCTASFGSEAALTGHISKKHLLNTTNATNNTCSTADQATSTIKQSSSGEGPFKCTYPGCRKSFMYKQVRDEHVAFAHNNEKQYCPICKQYLNGEGSNFRRHMASHQPKHTHMLCKFHHLGCKKRFPRLDNLRRHEGCCKFGKKAAVAALGANSPAVSVTESAGSAASRGVRAISPGSMFGKDSMDIHHHHHHHHHHDHPYEHDHDHDHDHDHEYIHGFNHGHPHPYPHPHGHPHGFGYAHPHTHGFNYQHFH